MRQQERQQHAQYNVDSSVAGGKLRATHIANGQQTDDLAGLQTRIGGMGAGR